MLSSELPDGAPDLRGTVSTEAAAAVLKTAGQRRVHIIWEATQAIIALTVTIAVVFCAIKGIESEILGNAFILVVSMYLVRTNHTRVSGTPAESR